MRSTGLREQTVLLLFLFLAHWERAAFGFVPCSIHRHRFRTIHGRFSSSLEDRSAGKKAESDPVAFEQEKENNAVPKSVSAPVHDPPSMTASQLMSAFGTSPRRIFLSLTSATAIALVGNLFGVTSKVLQAVPEASVEASGLDTYFPRGDFKRCIGKGYTFVFPKEWVADTFVELAKAQQRTKPLDYEMRRSSRKSILPDSAFGPPGRLNRRGVSEQGDTNVSVLVSSVMQGFSLEGTLGSPTSAAETLLRVSLAPEGSGKTATLIDAFEDTSRDVYQFEYRVDRGERGPPLRAISVIAARNGDTLYTLTVVAQEQDWTNAGIAKKLRKVASSFHLR